MKSNPPTAKPIRHRIPPMNSFTYTFGEKRFHTLDYHLKSIFGKKTVKLPVDGGLGCPNRDGSCGVGGCSFCSGVRSGEFAGNKSRSITCQIEEQKAFYKKWPDALYISYFQAGSNTYAPVDVLRRLYDEALACKDVVGISISTRPDCIDEDIADLLAEYHRRTYLTVELGLQSSKDSTLDAINRGHDYAAFLRGYKLLKDRGIRVCVHIINGLPGETKEDMLQTVRELAGLGIDEIKIHLLHIISGTRTAEDYTNSKLSTLDYDEYIEILCDQLELLPPETVVSRVTGDGDKRTLIAPLWSTDKRRVLNGIDMELRRRNTYQGIKYTK